MTKEELYNLIQIKQAELDLLKKKLRELIYGNADSTKR
jgi:hypothetical protein